MQKNKTIVWHLIISAVLWSSNACVQGAQSELNGAVTQCCGLYRPTWHLLQQTVKHVISKDKMENMLCIIKKRVIFSLIEATKNYAQGKDLKIIFYSENNGILEKIEAIYVDIDAFDEVLMRYHNWLLIVSDADLDTKKIESIEHYAKDLIIDCHEKGTLPKSKCGKMVDYERHTMYYCTDCKNKTDENSVNTIDYQYNDQIKNSKSSTCCESGDNCNKDEKLCSHQHGDYYNPNKESEIQDDSDNVGKDFFYSISDNDEREIKQSLPMSPESQEVLLRSDGKSDPRFKNDMLVINNIYKDADSDNVIQPLVPYINDLEEDNLLKNYEFHRVKQDKEFCNTNVNTIEPKACCSNNLVYPFSRSCNNNDQIKSVPINSNNKKEDISSYPVSDDKNNYQIDVKPETGQFSAATLNVLDTPYTFNLDLGNPFMESNYQKATSQHHNLSKLPQEIMPRINSYNGESDLYETKPYYKNNINEDEKYKKKILEFRPISPDQSNIYNGIPISFEKVNDYTTIPNSIRTNNNFVAKIPYAYDNSHNNLKSSDFEKYAYYESYSGFKNPLNNNLNLNNKDYLLFNPKIRNNIRSEIKIPNTTSPVTPYYYDQLNLIPLNSYFKPLINDVSYKLSPQVANDNVTDKNLQIDSISKINKADIKEAPYLRQNNQVEKYAGQPQELIITTQDSQDGKEYKKYFFNPSSDLSVLIPAPSYTGTDPNTYTSTPIRGYVSPLIPQTTNTKLNGGISNSMILYDRDDAKLEDITQIKSLPTDIVNELGKDKTIYTQDPPTVIETYSAPKKLYANLVSNPSSLESYTPLTIPNESNYQLKYLPYHYNTLTPFSTVIPYEGLSKISSLNPFNNDYNNKPLPKSYQETLIPIKHKIKQKHVTNFVDTIPNALPLLQPVLSTSTTCKKNLQQKPVYNYPEHTDFRPTDKTSAMFYTPAPSYNTFGSIPSYHTITPLSTSVASNPYSGNTNFETKPKMTNFDTPRISKTLLLSYQLPDTKPKSSSISNCPPLLSRNVYTSSSFPIHSTVSLPDSVIPERGSRWQNTDYTEPQSSSDINVSPHIISATFSSPFITEAPKTQPYANKVVEKPTPINLHQISGTYLNKILPFLSLNCIQHLTPNVHISPSSYFPQTSILQPYPISLGQSGSPKDSNKLLGTGITEPQDLPTSFYSPYIAPNIHSYTSSVIQTPTISPYSKNSLATHPFPIYAYQLPGATPLEPHKSSAFSFLPSFMPRAQVLPPLSNPADVNYLPKNIYQVLDITEPQSSDNNLSPHITSKVALLPKASILNPSIKPVLKSILPLDTNQLSATIPMTELQPLPILSSFSSPYTSPSDPVCAPALNPRFANFEVANLLPIYSHQLLGANLTSPQKYTIDSSPYYLKPKCHTYSFIPTTVLPSTSNSVFKSQLPKDLYQSNTVFNKPHSVSIFSSSPYIASNVPTYASSVFPTTRVSPSFSIPAVTNQLPLNINQVSGTRFSGLPKPSPFLLPHIAPKVYTSPASLTPKYSLLPLSIMVECASQLPTKSYQLSDTSLTEPQRPSTLNFLPYITSHVNTSLALLHPITSKLSQPHDLQSFDNPFSEKYFDIPKSAANTLCGKVQPKQEEVNLSTINNYAPITKVDDPQYNRRPTSYHALPNSYYKQYLTPYQYHRASGSITYAQPNFKLSPSLLSSNSINGNTYKKHNLTLYPEELGNSFNPITTPDLDLGSITGTRNKIHNQYLPLNPQCLQENFNSYFSPTQSHPDNNKFSKPFLDTRKYPNRNILYPQPFKPFNKFYQKVDEAPNFYRHSAPYSLNNYNYLAPTYTDYTTSKYPKSSNYHLQPSTLNYLGNVFRNPTEIMTIPKDDDIMVAKLLYTIPSISKYSNQLPSTPSQELFYLSNQNPLFMPSQIQPFYELNKNPSNYNTKYHKPPSPYPNLSDKTARISPSIPHSLSSYNKDKTSTETMPNQFDYINSTSLEILNNFFINPCRSRKIATAITNESPFSDLTGLVDGKTTDAKKDLENALLFYLKYYLNNIVTQPSNHDNSYVTIPLNDIAIIGSDGTDYRIDTNDPNVYIRMWNTKLQLVEPKLIFDLKDVNINHFMPVVNKRTNYDSETIRQLAKSYVARSYGEPIIVYEPYEAYKVHTILNGLKENQCFGNKCHILWPERYY